MDQGDQAGGQRRLKCEGLCSGSRGLTCSGGSGATGLVALPLTEAASAAIWPLAAEEASPGLPLEGQDKEWVQWAREAAKEHDSNPKVLVEMCCDEDSALGEVAKEREDFITIRVTRQTADVGSIGG